MKLFYACIWLLVVSISTFDSSPASAASDWYVGVAKVDITPDEPVRLSGYASRLTPADGIEDRLSARALILSPQDPQTKPSAEGLHPDSLVIVSIDAIGISAVMTEKILDKVLPSLKIPRSRIVFCTTHSHTAPHLEGLIPNLFGVPIPDAEQQAMLRTTQMNIDRIAQVILDAKGTLKPGTVDYGLGRAEFAINRRMLKDKQWVGIGTVDEGPVDRNVRVLRVRDNSGKLVAVSYQYACHSTSISPNENKISGDWGGISAGIIETANPGCIALPIIGCGADANPNPRGTIALSRKHGAEMAESVQKVLGNELKPLPHPTNAAFVLVALASERPNKQKLEAMQKSNSAHERSFANTWLELLSRKDRIPETYPAPVHLWSFGKDLAWVFMGGEVVVDYQIRIEKELSQFDNVWVAGYVDDVFAYVASERVRGEGGYEVDGSMLYYGQPGRWESGTEEKIVDRVLQMTKQKHLADEPRSPQESLASIEVPEGYTIELVASEPLVTDPVGIAWGTDGKVWVVEMGDYPLGGGKTGCVKTLEDTDGDGVMDKSTVFLDGLNYPAGIYAWGPGVMIACAPDIFYAEDTDGDGKCDRKEVYVTGFPEGNPQHRVHGFTYGMDHRLYFGPGGGANTVTVPGKTGEPKSMRISGSDLSLNPVDGDLRLETGVTQFIRTTDEYGNWFGNENSLPMFHYVFPQSWIDRSGYRPKRRYQLITNPPSIPPVFPISQQADRFNDLYAINRFTSACSTVINRGEGQGEAMRGFAMVCEPVHNMVVRYELKPSGATWSASRIATDNKSEFIRSTDPWFRPVRIENAPDGTMWIVDMYRYVIEHPEWIPEEWQRRINLRAGEDRGRIYRIRRSDYIPKPLEKLNKKSDSELIDEVAGLNSARADLAQQVLLQRLDSASDSSKEQILGALQRLFIETNRSALKVRAANILIHQDAFPKDKLDRVVRSCDAQTLRFFVDHAEQIGLTQEARTQLWAAIDPDMLRASAALAMSVAVESSQDSQPPVMLIAQALVTHAQDAWMLDASNFLKPTSIDGVLREVLDSKLDIKNLQKVAERLVPKVSKEFRAELLSSVANHQGSRPAWHYLLAKQFASGDATGLDESAIKRIMDSARDSWRSFIKDSSMGDPATLIAGLNLLTSRMGSTWTEDHDLLLDALARGEQTSVDSELALGLVGLGGSAGTRMLQRWKDLSLVSRSVVLNKLVQNEDGAREILGQVKKGQISSTDIDAITIQILRSNRVDDVSKLASEIFGPAPGADRPAIVRESLSRWPSKTDTSLGQIAYQKHCAVCHEGRTRDEQFEESLAPNLRGLSHWTNEAWMNGILDPNRSVEEKYWVFQARTLDGELLTGLKLREDDTSIQWVNSTGRIESLDKSQIEDIKTSERSLMPEGFEQLLTPEEIAGIISYLRTSSPAKGN
jgi:putative membrane-bound dehydrogenase-like protein